MKVKLLSLATLATCSICFSAHITSDGKGGYYLPNGGHVMSDGKGGHYLPNGGGHVMSDGKGGYYTPN